MMKYISYAVIIIVLIPMFALAQNVVPFNGDATLIINPDHPDEYSLVRAKVRSFSFDINRSVIVWKVDGVRQLYGVGKKEFQFTTGKLGSLTRLSVSITTPSGEKIIRNATIRPTSVDILWEAETTSPNWYRGKSLPAPGSYIRVTALPHIFVNGVRAKSSSLVYAWRVRGKNIESISGYGSNTMRFRMSDFLEPNEVSVTVSTFDGNITAQSSTEIPAVFPAVSFYEDNAEQGVQFYRAITDNYKLSGQDLVIVAEPFNFDRENRSSIEYEWRVNDARVQADSGGKGNKMFFRVKDGVNGTSRIDLKASNPENILQTVKMFFNVVF